MVGCDILSPEGGVGLGLGGVERAAVPEAPVDEDGEFARAEDEVGPIEERLVTPSAGDAVKTEDRRETQLGGFVVERADRGHYFGSLTL